MRSRSRHRDEKSKLDESIEDLGSTNETEPSKIIGPTACDNLNKTVNSNPSGSSSSIVISEANKTLKSNESLCSSVESVFEVSSKTANQS
jgi:hypothetical protein